MKLNKKTIGDTQYNKEKHVFQSVRFTQKAAFILSICTFVSFVQKITTI